MGFYVRLTLRKSLLFVFLCPIVFFFAFVLHFLVFTVKHINIKIKITYVHAHAYIALCDTAYILQSLSRAFSALARAAGWAGEREIDG